MPPPPTTITPMSTNTSTTVGSSTPIALKDTNELSQFIGGGVTGKAVNRRFERNVAEGPLDSLADGVAHCIRAVGRRVSSLIGRSSDPSKGGLINAKAQRNIRMMFYFRFFNGIAFAARAGGVFDGYIYGLFGDNKTVGLIGTLSGAASITSAPIVGFLADYYKAQRAKLLRICAACAVVCLVTHSYAVSSKSLPLLLLSAFCWRAWYEFVFVISESLFADSCPQGMRSEYFTKRRVVTTLANSAGPLVTAAMLWWIQSSKSASADGTYSVKVMETLLHFALTLTIPQIIALCFWEDISDEVTLAAPPLELSNSSTTTSARDVEIAPLLTKQHTSAAAAAGEDHHADGDSINVKEPHDPVHEDHQESKLQAGDTGDGTELNLPDRRFFCLGPKSVPYIMLLSHMVQCAGAGMTVKFFPLFFKTEYGLKPIAGCFLASGYTLFITGFTIILLRLSKIIGRPQASLAFTCLGILALLILSHTYKFTLVIAMYVIRGALQNASAPVDRSIQMDYVAAGQRGRWTALESLLTMAWAFSALFGGFLADMHDYRTTFRITTCVFVVSTILYLPLLWLVPRDESFAADKKPKRC
eukprot:Lankesteria_metandrocarpae@DN5194_c1_g1_i1.p1